MKTRHTPGPWGIGKLHDESRGTRIVQIDGYGNVIRLIAIVPPEKDWSNEQGNAEFIVRAVNSHEALLDLSEGVLLGLQKIADVSSKIPGTYKIQEFALSLHSHIEGQLKAIANMEERP